ncbi:MAG: NUDIX hydrolase [Anaerolineales bacterium]|nr:NUDIX hydrolase [Anaerolineales bacterium]
MDVSQERAIPQWLEWGREIQALSQSGIHFAENTFQRERYERLMEIAAEILSTFSDLETVPLMGLFNNQIGYATPRVDVRGAIFRDEKLLLVRERQDGGWTMPGGWADVGDMPSEAVEREVNEEAGFKVRAQKIIGVYDANRTGPWELFHAFKIVFLCEIISGEARTSNETSDVGFFALENLPEKLSGERTRPRHIMDAFSNLVNPGCATIFD